jgi:hypothetical protein
VGSTKSEEISEAQFRKRFYLANPAGVAEWISSDALRKS